MCIYTYMCVYIYIYIYIYVLGLQHGRRGPVWRSDGVLINDNNDNNHILDNNSNNTSNFHVNNSMFDIDNRRSQTSEKGEVLLRGFGTLRYSFILSEKPCLSSAHLCRGSLMV